MTVTDLDILVRAAGVCPILGIGTNPDGSLRIDFDPSATPTQQQAAQNLVTANASKVNGNPSRIQNDIIAIFNYLSKSVANGGGGLTAQQQQTVNLLCSSVVLAMFPQLAMKINQQTSLQIPYDQPNPNG